MRVKTSAAPEWTEPGDNLTEIPAFVLELSPGTFVYVEKLAPNQWVVHNTAPDLDGVADQPDALFPLMDRIGFLNRGHGGGWLARLEGERKTLALLHGVRLEEVVSELVKVHCETP